MYNKKGNKFFFEGNKYDTPLKKIKEFGVKHSLLVEKYAVLEDQLSDIKYESWPEDKKNLLVEFSIQNIPYSDCDNSLPFIDFLRLAVQFDTQNVLFCNKSGEDCLMKIFKTYFVDLSFDKEKNPKAVRIISWRFLANLMKFGHADTLLSENWMQILQALTKVLETMTADKSLINGMVMACNNFFITEVIILISKKIGTRYRHSAWKRKNPICRKIMELDR